MTIITDTPCYATIGATTVEGRKWEFSPLMPHAGDTSADADTFRERNAGKSLTCDVFHHIQYGQAPVGNLRFRDSVAYTLPDGTYDATAFRTVPYQEYALERGTNGRPEWGMDVGGVNWAKMGVVESEDCLNLTVYTPDSGETDLPVISFIHGGGWDVTSAINLYDRPHRLSASRGVVVVSIEYRLGHFGHFFAPEMIAEGTVPNFALSDQLLALQWVNDNIASFGGDPDNIMIMGPSAGGASVLTLLESPSAHGLFNKAWPISGGGLGHRYGYRPSWQNEGYAAMCGRYTRTLFSLRDLPDYSGTYGSVGEAIDEEGELWALRHAVSPDQITLMHSGFLPDGDHFGGQNHFPFQTANLPSRNATNACMDGLWPSGVPVCFGVAQNEASVLGIRRFEDELSINADGYARVAGFFGGRELEASEFFDGLSEAERNRMIYSTVIYWAPVHMQAYERARRGEDAFVYLWNYKDAGNGLDYASHTVDVYYFFGNLEWATGMSGDEAAIYVDSLRLSENMMDNIARFAKYGRFDVEYTYPGNWDLFDSNPAQPFESFNTSSRIWNVVGNLTRNANNSPPTVEARYQWYNAMLETYRRRFRG